jgi:hypothetical protein
MTALSEHRHDPSQSTPAGSGPNAWQLVLWRFLAVVASTPDDRSSVAFNGYRRRHPFRWAVYVVAALVGVFLAFEVVAVLVAAALESLPIRPRSAADFGLTMLALFGIFALWSAAGRWLRHVVTARVNRWRTGRPLEG